MYIFVICKKTRRYMHVIRLSQSLADVDRRKTTLFTARKFSLEFILVCYPLNLNLSYSVIFVNCFNDS